MKKTVITFSAALLLLTSCKKDRVCECTNINNTYEAGEFYGTRSQAKKFCKGLSEGQTECKLK